MSDHGNKSRLTLLKWWRWLSATVALVLLNRSLDIVTPDYAYYHDGQILYPLLAHYGIVKFIVLALLILTLVFGLFKTMGKWRVAMIAISIPLVCGLPLADISSGYDHIDDIQVGDHTYHLGFSYGGEPGWDYNLYVYIVWECDGDGLVCERIDNPYSESNLTAQIPQHEARLFYEESEHELYVQVDADLYPVAMDNLP